MLKTLRFAAPIVTLFAVGYAGPALAYIGPGVGLGAIAVTIALLLGVLLLAIGLVWYPLKRVLKRGTKARSRTPPKAEAE